jgi:hypothetical protein
MGMVGDPRKLSRVLGAFRAIPNNKVFLVTKMTLKFIAIGRINLSPVNPLPNFMLCLRLSRRFCW